LPPVLSTVLFAAEAGAEPDKTLFYVAGVLLVVFALALSAAGISRHDRFPPSKGAARGVMGLAVLLVAFTMAAAVITA
jgi:hypothetical protein